MAETANTAPQIRLGIAQQNGRALLTLVVPVLDEDGRTEPQTLFVSAEGAEQLTEQLIGMLDNIRRYNAAADEGGGSVRIDL